MTDRLIRQAVILAAGRGTRMGEITAEVPKPMLPVHGRPMLEHILERLASAGVESFLIVVGYHRELIQNYFQNWKLPVQFRVQETVDGTGSAARLARDFAAAGPFFLTFGDILCDPSAYLRCEAVLRAHPETDAVLGVKDIDDPYRAAAVYVHDGKVTHIIEKPPKGSSTTRWASAGLYAFRPIVFDYLDRIPLSPRNEYEITSIFDMMLADHRELRVSEMDESWRDVGRPEDLAAVNAAPEPLLPKPPDHPDQD